MSGPFTSPFGANANPFGTQQMGRLMEEDENEGGPTSTFGGDAATELPPTAKGPPSAESYPAQYNFNRRTSVSAESLKPNADGYDNWSPPLHEKSADQLERLQKAIEGNFLFSHLEEEQSAQILGALVEKPIPAKGIKVSALESRC